MEAVHSQSSFVPSQPSAAPKIFMVPSQPSLHALLNAQPSGEADAIVPDGVLELPAFELPPDLPRVCSGESDPDPRPERLFGPDIPPLPITDGGDNEVTPGGGEAVAVTLAVAVGGRNRFQTSEFPEGISIAMGETGGNLIPGQEFCTAEGMDGELNVDMRQRIISAQSVPISVPISVDAHETRDEEEPLELDSLYGRDRVMTPADIDRKASEMDSFYDANNVISPKASADLNDSSLADLYNSKRKIITANSTDASDDHRSLYKSSVDSSMVGNDGSNASMAVAAPIMSASSRSINEMYAHSQSENENATSRVPTLGSSFYSNQNVTAGAEDDQSSDNDFYAKMGDNDGTKQS